MWNQNHENSFSKGILTCCKTMTIELRWLAIGFLTALKTIHVLLETWIFAGPTSSLFSILFYFSNSMIIFYTFSNCWFQLNQPRARWMRVYQLNTY